MAAVAHFPASLDRGPLERVRRPLAAIAALVLVVDLMALGLHLVDAVPSPFANDDPSPAQARIGGPEAVVPSSDAVGPRAGRAAPASERAAEPYGCLSATSGCYAGPPAPGATPPGNTSTPPASPSSPKPVPVAQADLAVPSLGAQVSLGAGDGGCTTVDLTVIALGDCPPAAGDGPVVLNLGGSLLGD